MGPKERRSTVLSALEEAAIVSLRVQARLPLDDVFIALKDVIPHLSRSSLHRCLQQHGMKSALECGEGYDPDLRSLVWTRGRDLPLWLLAEGMLCPRCGSRRVRLLFTPPDGRAVAVA